jgi:hypothetical protein
MVRRFLFLGTVLLLLLSASACSGSKGTGPMVSDPDGNFVPKPAGGKPG